MSVGPPGPQGSAVPVQSDVKLEQTQDQKGFLLTINGKQLTVTELTFGGKNLLDPKSKITDKQLQKINDILQDTLANSLDSNETYKHVELTSDASEYKVDSTTSKNVHKVTKYPLHPTGTAGTVNNLSHKTVSNPVNNCAAKQPPATAGTPSPQKAPASQTNQGLNIRAAAGGAGGSASGAGGSASGAGAGGTAPAALDALKPVTTPEIVEEEAAVPQAGKEKLAEVHDPFVATSSTPPSEDGVELPLLSDGVEKAREAVQKEGWGEAVKAAGTNIAEDFGLGIGRGIYGAGAILYGAGRFIVRSLGSFFAGLLSVRSTFRQVGRLWNRDIQGFKENLFKNSRQVFNGDANFNYPTYSIETEKIRFTETARYKKFSGVYDLALAVQSAPLDRKIKKLNKLNSELKTKGLTESATLEELQNSGISIPDFVKKAYLDANKRQIPGFPKYSEGSLHVGSIIEREIESVGKRKSALYSGYSKTFQYGSNGQFFTPIKLYKTRSIEAGQDGSVNLGAKIGGARNDAAIVIKGLNALFVGVGRFVWNVVLFPVSAPLRIGFGKDRLGRVGVACNRIAMNIDIFRSRLEKGEELFTSAPYGSLTETLSPKISRKLNRSFKKSAQTTMSLYERTETRLLGFHRSQYFHIGLEQYKQSKHGSAASSSTDDDDVIGDDILDPNSWGTTSEGEMEEM